MTDTSVNCGPGSRSTRRSSPSVTYLWVNARSEKGTYPLNEACRQGDLDKVAELLRCGADLSLTDVSGHKAIHSAASNNQQHVIEYLLGHKSCDKDEQSAYKETPLHIACLNGHLDTAKLLVQHGADLNARDDKGNTVLHFSAAADSGSLLRFLLMERGCGNLVNVTNKDGDTAAHRAACLGCPKAVSALRNFGADLAIRNHQGLTPCALATEFNNRETERSMMETSAECTGHRSEHDSDTRPETGLVAGETTGSVGIKWKKGSRVHSLVSDPVHRSQSDRLPRRVREGKKEEKEKEGSGEVKGESVQETRAQGARPRERSHSDKQRRKKKPQAV